MNRRSKRKVTTSPSLFPFLAVLICTMGAIIVLLVLVVKHADDQANAGSVANKKELEDKRQGLSDQLEFKTNLVENLEELRPELKSRLAKEKANSGHLADHVSRLKLELERLQKSLASIGQKRQTGQTADQRSAELQKLQSQIAAAQKEFENRREEITKAKPAYSIIPAAGTGNGTFRRPIFVECEAEGVTLQPYGITLLPADFPSNLAPDNPLDLALLMIRDYWNQVDPNRSSGQPYPLFVVRPSGSRAFAAARKAMKSWVDEFGYELVSADIEIEYPEADPAFQQRLQDAINHARFQQQNRVSAVSRQQIYGRMRAGSQEQASPQGFRASSVNGGFVKERSDSAGSGSGSKFSRASNKSPSTSTSKFAAGSTAANGASRNSFEKNPLFNPAANSTDKGRATSGGFGGPNGSPSSGQSFGSQNLPADPELPSTSLARSRGKDWALPSKANNSIQVRKPIKVQITQSEIRIVEIGKGIKSIPFGNSTATAIPKLVEQVWKHIDAWGIAGINSYWKPTLNLYVSPDAQNRFEDLKALLYASGMELNRVEP